jgi:hypothetical protein
MFKNTAIGIAIGLLVMGGIWGLVHLMGDNSSVSSEVSAPKSMPGGSKGVMDLICELQLDLDGQLALGIKENEPARVAMAQIDFDQKSGWYQGKIAISESRAGTVTLMGTRVKVYRPALFQRFGATVSGEEFVVDRKTGQFEQSLNLSDGRNVKLIKGTCAQVIKPPF